MDEPKHYHIKWSKPDRERQIYDIAHMWNLKKKEPIQMSLYTTQKQTHRQKKQMYGYQRGKWVGRIYEFEINMNQKKTPEAVFNKGLLSTY